MQKKFVAIALVAALPLAGCAQSGGDGAPLITSTTTSEGSGPREGAKQRTAAAPKLPRCERPLGKLAVVEKDIPALTQLGLGTATPVLKVMIGQSGCFQIVDHQQALAHGASGRRVAKADFLLDPDVVTQSQKGGHLAGGLGSLLPGNVGVIAGSITTSSTEAQTSLFLTDARTGVQVATATGASKTEDVGLALPGYELIGGYGGDNGKTVIAAFQNAYINLVGQMQSRPAVASRR